MSTFKLIVSAAAAALALTTAVVQSAQAAPGDRSFRGDRFAGVHTPGIDRRLARQHDRIARARRDGRLSRVESWRVRAALFRIRQAKRWAARDGIVDGFERRGLHRMLDNNSERIRNLSTNSRFAGFGGRDRALFAPENRGRSLGRYNGFR